MRLGIALDESTAVATAAAADRNGIPAVLVAGGELGSGIALAAAIAATTRDIRIVVTIPLGAENPITLAEELSVVDHISGGRTLALVDTSNLDAEAAIEDVALLREAWSGRWVQHRGSRWTIPLGAHGEGSPEAVSVTPWPAQLEMPVWLTGQVAADVAAVTGLPVLISEMPSSVDDRALIVPARTAIVGELDVDRVVLNEWAASGVSHLFISLPAAFGDEQMQQVVARYLVPEVSTPNFPRIVAESSWPMPWRH